MKTSPDIFQVVSCCCCCCWLARKKARLALGTKRCSRGDFLEALDYGCLNSSCGLRQLRRNDPQQFHLSIFLDLVEDAAIAQALERNQYVSRVELQSAQRVTSWHHLCRVLATRANLVHFSLIDSSNSPEERNSPFLQATQQNAAVRVVEFCNNNLDAADLCSFLDNSAQITDFQLVSPHLCFARENGVREKWRRPCSATPTLKLDASAGDETLKFFLDRNTRLARCVENPETVPKHLWKEACTLASKAGLTMLFRLLRKVGPEVLPVRERKRNG